MAITSTNYTDISYIEEVTTGTIPNNAPTNFQILPTTGGSPMNDISTVVSEVIRADRQTDDLVVVDGEITGDVEFELSYVPWKPILAAFMRKTVDTTTYIGSDYYINGNETATTFTFVKRAIGVADPTYWYYRGCAINQIVLNFETGSILTGTMSVFGLDEVTATDASPLAGLTSQAFLDPAAYTVMNSVTHLATPVVSGLPAGTEFMSMSLTMNNNTTGAKAIGTLGSIETADFTLDITADVSLYFQDLTAYNYFLQATNFSITATLTDAAGNILEIKLPYCKFETLETPIEGKDNFLMLNGTLRALRDPANDLNMISLKFTDI